MTTMHASSDPHARHDLPQVHESLSHGGLARPDLN